MTVYITPDKVEEFQKKFNNMVRHFEKQPKVEFSEPKMVDQITYTIINNGWGYYGDGRGGHKRTKKVINVIEVTIDEIGQGDWILVADVFYKEGVIKMVSNEHFKNIPIQFGLEYSKCDYCGKIHSNRNKAHIIYNVKTGEWKHIGTSCANKMFEVGKYMSSFTIQLYKLVEEKFGGCCDEMLFKSWISSQPDHYFQDTLAIDWVIPVVVDYRKNVSTLWEKSSYDYEAHCKVPGTTDFLNEHFNKISDLVNVDENYNKRIKDFIQNLPEGEFNNSIKSSFECEYLQRFEIFKVFFAVKMYEDSLTVETWEGIKKKYPIGECVEIKNGQAQQWTENYGFYGLSWLLVVKDENGQMFCKSVSNQYTFMDKFCNDEGKYNFSAKVTGFDDRRRVVILGGTAKKIK